jgi:peptide/nickel transport system substrate-binding protein
MKDKLPQSQASSGISRLPDRKLLAAGASKVEKATLRHARKFVVDRWSNMREVQWHVVAWVMLMGFLIAVTGLQLDWYQKNYQIETPASDSTYAEATIGPVNTLNPLYATTDAELTLSKLMFSSLLTYDKTGHLSNDLARSIQSNDLGNVYTVVLRDDARWHDGRKVTVDDVIFTIETIQHPNTRSVVSGWGSVDVTRVDDHTIQFGLSSSYVAFAHSLTFPVLPKHLLENTLPINLRESSFSQNPIGSGPFTFNLSQTVDTDKKRKIIYLNRNENYYHAKANLAKFQLRVYENVDEVLRSLVRREVNAASSVSSVDVESIDKSKYSVLSRPIRSGVFLLMNNRSEIMDQTMRKTLALATDRQAIRDQLGANSLAMDLPFFADQLQGDMPSVLAYDADLAASQLEQNGWVVGADGVREKNGAKLELNVVAPKGGEYERALEMISGQWSSVGVSVKPTLIDIADPTRVAIQTVLQPRNYDVLLYQLNIGADPDVYAYWHSSQATAQGFNLANYSNAISDDALATARSRLDPNLRNAKYLTFAKQWVADTPAIGLYQSTSYYVQSKKSFTLCDCAKLVSPVDRYAAVIDWSVDFEKSYSTP